jgi:hypothetical protein
VFRSNVLLRETFCRVTRVDVPRHLNASHMKRGPAGAARPEARRPPSRRGSPDPAAGGAAVSPRPGGVRPGAAVRGGLVGADAARRREVRRLGRDAVEGVPAARRAEAAEGYWAKKAAGRPVPKRPRLRPLSSGDESG